MSYREMLPWAVAPCLIILVAGIGVSCLVYRNLSHEQVEPTQFCIHRSSSFWVLRMNVELVLTQLVSRGDWSCFPVASRDSSEPCGGCTRPHLATERPLDAFPGNLFRISRRFSINSWTLCVKQLQTQPEQGFGCIRAQWAPNSTQFYFTWNLACTKFPGMKPPWIRRGQPVVAAPPCVQGEAGPVCRENYYVNCGLTSLISFINPPFT